MTGAMIESVEVNGGRLGFEVAGAGPAVAFVHPGSWDRRTWDDQSPVFAGRYRVVRQDVRGYGGRWTRADSRGSSRQRSNGSRTSLPRRSCSPPTDIPHMQRLSRIVAERIPGARLVQIPDTDQVVNMRRPAEFNQVVPEFLGEVL